MKRKAPEINFLRKQRSILMLQSKRLYLIQTLSLMTLLAYGVVLIGVISYSAYLGFNVKRIDKNIESERAAIKQLTNVRAKYLVLKEKTAAIMGVSSSLFKHQEIIEKVISLLPDGLAVQGFSIDENGDVVFSASTANPDMIDTFFENVERNKHDERVPITVADVSSVRVDEEGKYSFGMTLTLNPKMGE